MLLLNFSHPLTDLQRTQINALVNEPVTEVRQIPVQFNHERSFAEQAAEIANATMLTPAQWQQVPLLIVPPSHALIAAVLLAELHGRMGYFATVVRLKPVPDSTPPVFEIAEVINLQSIRDNARISRTS